MEYDGIAVQIGEIVERSEFLKSQSVMKYINSGLDPLMYPLFIFEEDGTGRVLAFMVMSATNDSTLKSLTELTAAPIWYVYAVGVLEEVRTLQSEHQVPSEQRMGVQLLRKALRHVTETNYPRRKTKVLTVKATVDNTNIASVKAFRKAWEAEKWESVQYIHKEGDRLDVSKGVEAQKPGSFNIVMYKYVVHYMDRLVGDVIKVHPDEKSDW